MSLEDAIAEARATAETPPPNESTTCEWIIYPLLKACGYAYKDIISRVADNDGKFPDYSILPDSPRTWYLEAKDWNFALQDPHAQQAMTYAYHNGKRWVVLTNGRYWRLYDSDIKGVAKDRFVCEACLHDDSMTGFLTAIRKDSMVGGDVIQYADAQKRIREEGARRTLLHDCLGAQLADPGSDVVRAIWKVVRGVPGLVGVARSEVVAYFGFDESSPETTDETPPALPGGQTSLEALHKGRDQLTPGSKPSQLTFPGGDHVSVTSWRELAKAIVVWLARQDKLPPMPFSSGERSSDLYFLNSGPDHKLRPMRSAAEIKLDERVVYLDTWHSAAGLVRCLRRLCIACDVPASDLLVMISPQGGAGSRPLTK